MHCREEPYIVALGGTTRPDSSTEIALAYSLEAAKAAGARVRLFGSDLLSALPIYDPWTSSPSPLQSSFVDAVREADGLIISSPAYHGSISGVIKNALDTLELTARDASPYLQGKPVGAIITSYGWQAAGTSLMALRSIIHALRGWPTPMGATLNCAERPFKRETLAADGKHARALETVAHQVVEFATGQARGYRGAA
jgi:FMN reductase